jgi:hypothetical protein
MTDFVILPMEDNSGHNAIRGFNIDCSFDENCTFLDYVHFKNVDPKVNWFLADDWSLRLLGDGTANGCDNYLILGRPGGDYAKQLDLKMSVEVDVETAVNFLKANPSVSSAVFGTIFLGSNQGQISTSDILAGCSWMARLGGKIVECSDLNISYKEPIFDLTEYLTVTPFGKNGCYLITTNPSTIKHSASVFGVCKKTGSKFITMPKNEHFHNVFISHPLFSNNCTVLPNDITPSHILVGGNEFTMNIHDTMMDLWGISTAPTVNVISNIPYTKENNVYTFNFTNKEVGVINFGLDLGHSRILSRLSSKYFPNHTITVMRK